MTASLPKNLSSEGCVDRLLTPAINLGNGFSARAHVLGGEVYIQPTNMPHRLYGRRFKSVPVITDMGDKRFKIAGTLSDGNSYEDEIVLPA